MFLCTPPIHERDGKGCVVEKNHEVLVNGEWRQYTTKAWDAEWATECKRIKAKDSWSWIERLFQTVDVKIFERGVDLGHFQHIYEAGGDRCGQAQLDLARCKRREAVVALEKQALEYGPVS